MQFDLNSHLRSQSFLAKLSVLDGGVKPEGRTAYSVPQNIKRNSPRKINVDSRNEIKFEEKVRRVVMTLCSHRKRLKYDKVYKYTTDMIKVYSIKPDRGRETTLINILFAVIYGCRKNNIYIDPLLVSGELDFSYKKLMKKIFGILPYTSSTSIYDVEMTKTLVTVNLMEICEEYVDVIMRGDERILNQIFERSEYIYKLIERTDVLSTEKQFCVTPGKIVAYVIMENDKNTSIHEKLMFPKLFFEKIKRVVNRAEKMERESTK